MNGGTLLPTTEAINNAFKDAAEQDAQLAKTMISGMGSKQVAFLEFYAAFKNLYNLTINNSKIRDAGYADNKKLVDVVQEWLDKARTADKSGKRGMELFKAYNIALGQVGLL